MTKFRVLLEAETEIEIQAEREDDAVQEALAKVDFQTGFIEQNWHCVGVERINDR